MTHGRRLALFLARYNWYNPHLGLENENGDDNDGEYDVVNVNVNVNANGSAVEKPSLNVAWEYFEHFVLPRYIVQGTRTSNANHDAINENDDDLSVDKSIDDDDLSEGSDFDNNIHSNGNGNGIPIPGSGKKKNKNLIRAEQGYIGRPTKLYPIFATSEEDMGDFGIGVGLYFNTVKYLSIIMLLAGAINVPNLLYFASEAYEGAGRKLENYGLWGE